MTDETSVKSPPYLPLKTFLGALDALREGVPKKIDRGIWRNYSGTLQGQTMIALRFFGLLDDSDLPTMPLLEQLAKAEEPERKKFLKPVVERAYHQIIVHDLTKMTPRMLDEEIGNFGLTGDTRRKAVTFFLQLAKYLELPLSAFLMNQTRSSPGKKKPRTAKAAATNGELGSALPAVPSAAGSTASVNLDGGGTVTMIVTADVWKMPPNDRKFVLELVDKIQGYEKSLAGARPAEKAEGES